MTRLFLLVAIALVGFMRIHLALTRAFDPDEFAYLHWAWLVTHGNQPYRDFFFYIMPGFAWLLSPILSLTGDSINFLIASRVFLFLIYGFCAALVYRLSRSPVAVLIFLTFPVTVDKTIDIRPDMVMLLLYFASIMVQNSLLSGILFGASFLMFPKILFGLPALLYLLFSRKRRVLPWVVGSLLVCLGFWGYLGINNLIPQAITSITKDSLAVTGGKQGFSPLLLFTPYPLIYLTQGGVSLPWAVNTGVWILGFVGLVILLKKRESIGIFWLLFIAGNVLFVILFPAPYVQYFLPLSVAASVLVGYAIGKSMRIITIIAVITSISFFQQYRERVVPGAQNTEQLQVIRDVLALTQPDESIYDMVGSYVFRPDGFFICCHPYGEFVKNLTNPPSLLRESLITTKTKFLIMDRIGFVFWQTPEPDKSFLHSNYLPTKYNKIYSLGQEFRCKNGACTQYRLDNKPADNRSTNTFSGVITEKYPVTFEPQTASIIIDGKEIQNGQTLSLSLGAHRFSVSPKITTFRIQLTR